jgi:CzcA family heavy metal efflux pump
MEWLISLCVRHRAAVLAVTVILLAIGIWDARDTPLDVFPDFVPAQVSIQAEAPGFTPDQVEQLVTRPIEAAVNGAPALDRMQSESIPGLSVITMFFSQGTDPNRAHQDIAERIQRLAGALPEGVKAPQLSPLVSSTMDLLKVGLVSDKLDPYEMRDIADWVMKPLILGVPGVARVNVFGGEVREIHVIPDLDKLSAYGLSLTDLGDAVRKALALRGAGFIDFKAQRVLIESPVPKPDPEVIGDAVLMVRNNVPVKIGDLARVEIGPALKAGDTNIMGRPGILLTISSQYGANTMDTTSRLEAALAELYPRLEAQGITVYPAMHRPANFIESALSNLRDALAVAAVLTLIILLAFLRDLRSAFISFITIPLSLLAAIVVMKYMGHTLNTMTIGGLAVSIGVLVDDAIIGIENVLRRLSVNAASPQPLPRLEVVRRASLEIRSPVLYATLAVIVVFIPVFLMTGVQGLFISPLALSFMLAVVASLIVALTVTPALCALLLAPRDVHAQSRWIVALKRFQARVIGFVANRLVVVGVVLAAAFAGTLLWLPSLGGQFMPDFREGHFVVQTSSAVPGTSFDEMMALGQRISKELLALPYVETAEQQIGRAELGEDTWGPNRSEFHVELKPDAVANQGEAEEAIRKIVDSYPGLHTEVVTFLGDRFSESLTGETAAVVVNVFGNDLDALDQTGARIAGALGHVPGIVDLQFERQSAAPEIMVRPIPEAMAQYGLTRQDVLDVVQASFAGLAVGQTFEGSRTVGVVLILPPDQRNRPETIGRLTVHSAFGPVPLSKVAQVTPAVGRSAVRHLDGQRRAVITFNVSGRNIQDVVSDGRKAINALGDLPSGIYVRFAGVAEAEQAARAQITVFSILALVTIILILFMGFRRRTYPLLILVNLPFSMIGSILAVGVTGIGLSVGTLIGLVTVFGISSRNAILLLAHYEHLVDVENEGWTRQTVLRGAAERLVPILMTALVTGLGLTPLIAGIGHAGYEIEGPMAITVLGGLVSSTILNLLVMPALAERAGRAPKPSESLA